MKIFKNVKFMYACIIIAVVCYVVNLSVFFVSKSKYLIDFCSNIFVIVSLIWLIIAYNKKQKEIVKGLVVAMLSVELIYSIACVDYLMLVKKEALINLYVDILWVIIDAVILFIHMLINSSNDPSPKLIRLNQTLIIILNIISICIVISIIIMGIPEYLLWITPFVGLIFMYNTVICVEGRVEFFREIKSEK